MTAPLPIKVVSEAEAERCHYVVCPPAEFPTPFADNVKTSCALCGRAIQHRPHAPKKPLKVCIECVMAVAGPRH